MHVAERSLFDVGRGRPVCVTFAGHAPDAAVLFATVEGLRSQILERLRRLDGGVIRLAMTHHRARAMGLMTPDLPGSPSQGLEPVSKPGRSNGRPRHMSLGLNGETSPEQILRLSSAIGKYTPGPLDLREASAPEVGGLTLARLRRLIPAIVSVPVDPINTPELRQHLESGAILVVSTAQIEAMARNAQVEVIHVSDGPVPLEEAEDARFMLFREANGILEHVAILIGNRASWPDPLPVRIHSACLTGDLFGSLRCDCGDQLRGSLRVFAARGGGVLLYLAQEGRGIGLANKLRAYALQEQGLDTVDADGTMGFGADERCYDVAVEMLRQLQIERIQLLTNNPEKVRAVREAGIQVDRQPIYGTLNRHNLQYVRTKINRAGHWLGEMLSGTVPGK